MTKAEQRKKFLDIREHNFARVAVVIPRVYLSDPVRNAQEHIRLLEAAYNAGCVYAVCPELGLTGYSNGDLFFSDALLDESMQSLRTIMEWTKGKNLLVSVGMPLRVGDALANVAVTIRYGVPAAIAPKSYLPNYREFYEGRHFAPARDLQLISMKFLGHDVPIGNNILIDLGRDLTIFTEVCEDGWVPIPPSSLAALAGATIIANLSASNITIGKAAYRRDLFVGASGRNVAAQLYCAAGYGESSTDLAWDGDGFIAERGELMAEVKRFEREGSYIIHDVDLTMLRNDRMRQTSFWQNATDNRRNFIRVMVDEESALSSFGKPIADYSTLKRSIAPFPFVPQNAASRDERCRETFMIQATALARRLEQMPDAQRKVVIGISGGQDSTHALLVAVHAMDLLGLPRTKVTGITMPGFGTTKRTRNNAVQLMKALGIVQKRKSINRIANSFFFSAEYNPNVHGTDLLEFENAQAWARMQVLLNYSCRHGGIVVGTGDLSELALGWCTFGGDHFSHYGVNGGVPKTLISFLIGWAADKIFSDEPEAQKVLKDILATPISPELKKAAADGTIAQQTESVIGPYALHDFTIYYLIRFGFLPSRIARLQYHAFRGTYTMAEIKKWMRLFLKRFFQTQFKRSCLPDGPKVGLVCISPRGDWRMPSDANPEAWLRDLDTVPDEI